MLLLSLRKPSALMHINFIHLPQLILRKLSENLFPGSLNVMFCPAKILSCPSFEGGSSLLQVCIISGHPNVKGISEVSQPH